MRSSTFPRVIPLLALGALLATERSARCAEPSAPRTEPTARVPAGPPRHTGLADTIRESLVGDAYAEPSTWRPLALATFFTEGWDEAWVGPPPGEGGAPRQGWLNAFDGVFYRLGITTFDYAHDAGDNGDAYAGTLTLFTPFNRRLELRSDVPFVVSSKGSRNTYHTSFGDLSLGPRLLLSETQSFTQTFDVALRTPTGDVDNGNGVATDDRGPATTTLTFTPGFRSHLGANWYLLGGVEVPATRPEPFDYQLLAGLMKVW